MLICPNLQARTPVPDHTPGRGGHCDWPKGGNGSEPVTNPSKRPREAPILIASDVAVSNDRDVASALGVEIVYVERVARQADVQLLCYVEHVTGGPVDQEVGVARGAARYPGGGEPIREINLPGHVPANFRKHRAIKMFAAESARADQCMATGRRFGMSPGIRCRHAIPRLMALRRLGRLAGTGRADQCQRGCRKEAPHASSHTSDLQRRARSVEKGFP